MQLLKTFNQEVFQNDRSQHGINQTFYIYMHVYNICVDI